MLVSGLDLVRNEPDTTIAGSETAAVMLALLLLDVGSALVLLAVAPLLVLPSSIACAVTLAVTVAPDAMEPMVNVTTPLDVPNVPCVVVAERNDSSEPSVS